MARLASSLLAVLLVGLAASVAASEGWRAAPGLVLIAPDGRTVRLAHLHEAAPAPDALPTLQTWLADCEPSLQEVAPGPDRHGRIIALARCGEGESLQARLVRAGLARVEGRAWAQEGLAPLLALEAEARSAARGGWSGDAWLGGRVVWTPSDLRFEGPRDGFVLVEGRVREVTTVGGRIYLNFGEDWRRDTTAQLPTRQRRSFTAAGRDPDRLEGALLRIRGWLYALNGPMIDLTHPDQIELLEPLP